MLKYFSIFSFLICIYGCNSDLQTPSVDNVGGSYFPVAVGNYHIYDIEETNYNLAGSAKQIYQLRETVYDSFVNQAGHITYKFSRERNDGSGWKTILIGSIIKTNTQIIVNENNKPVVRLKFPVADGLVWNSNTYNASFLENFEMNLLIEPFVTKVDSYSDVLKVTIVDFPENITGIDQKFEYYSQNIGLISRNFKTLRYCTRNCTGQAQIEGGLELKQTLIDYGKN